MENIINQINNLYYQNLNENETITLLTKYIYHKLKEDNNLNYVDILNNENILFNQSNNSNIIIQVIHNLNNDLLDKNNYNNYVNSIKFILSIFIKKGKFYDNGKNYNDDIQIIHNQYKYLIDNINNLQVIPFDKKYLPLYIDTPKIQERNKKILNYSFQDKKEFNDKMILYSYLCYFKSAINSIKHNSLFKLINNIDDAQSASRDEGKPSSSSETLQIKINNALTKKEIVGGKFNKYDYYFIGGCQLLDLFITENVSIIEFVKIFNELTQNKYLIGTPGIKYYPYQILEEVFNLLPYPYDIFFKINMNYVIKLRLSLDIKDNINNLSNIIENYFFIMNNPINIYFSTIINDQDVKHPAKEGICLLDPMVNNVFTSMFNKKINYKEVDKLTYNLLHSNIYQYQYNYIINDYYLESICLIENISKNNKDNLQPLDFHNIYIKFLYDENYNIISIIRYDGNILEYNNYNMNKYKYMRIEYNKIFHKDYISDYIDGIINYKISMINYINKKYKELFSEIRNQNNI